MSPLIIGISGLRGIVGEGLTPEVAARFAAAFGTYLGGGKVALGRDSRTSGPMIHHAVLSGLLGVGCEVIDLGTCPTPTIQLATESLQVQGGIVITASHNPAPWNGIKLIGPEGIFLTEEQGKELQSIYDQQEIDWGPWDKLGKVQPYGEVVENHIQKILAMDLLDVDSIKVRGFRVVLDCCNGAGGVMGPELLRRLGCEIIELNCEPNGLFPRDPEPVSEHLGELCSLVKFHRADVGFALDPDGDRLAIVSEEGKPLGEEYSLAIATWFTLQHTQGPVVINLSTSKVIEDIAARHGVPVFRTPVGEVYVAQQMKQVRAVIGGEGNGGVILPQVHYGRDSFVGMALTLQALTESRARLTELVVRFPKYHIIKRRLEMEYPDPKKLMEFLRREYPNGKMELRDGLRIAGRDWWIHLRRSNTEPIVRVIAEARSEGEAANLCDRVISRLSPSPLAYG